MKVATIGQVQDFGDAAKNILEFLHDRLGFSLWMVTRTEGEDWIVLNAEDHGYNVQKGSVFRWSDSFCSRMVQGQGPQIAPCSRDVLAYAEAPIGKQVPIASYIGFPLIHPNGELFGTLCAIDPNPQPDTIQDEYPLIELLANLLSNIIGMELKAQEATRRLERVRAECLKDYLTGLYNHRGWDELVKAEEERCQKYGNPAAIILVDLDNFKSINETEGHAAGDHLLQVTTSYLKGIVPPSDVVARLGADEFGILTVEMSSTDSMQLAKVIQQELESAGLSASIGWAQRDPRKTLYDTYDLAQERLYLAKQTRKK